MKTVALGEIVDFYSGGTPSKSRPAYWQGEIPWFSAKDMKRPRLTNSADHIADEVFRSTSLRKLPAGTIAMVVRGMILAHTVPIAILDVDAAINQDLKALLPKREVDPSFLAAMLRAQHATILSQVSTAAHGTKKLDARVLENLQIPFPTLSEQRRIAALLEHADALRAKRRQVLTYLDSLAQALYEHMIGGNDWPNAKISTITSKVGSGATPRGGQSAYKKEGVALIRSMNVHDGEFRRKDLAFLDDQQAAALSNVVVEADDVLLNITGASVARVSRAPASVLPARVNQHVAIIRPTPGTVDPRILERHLISPRTKRALLNTAGGGATREAITKAQILDLEVPIPDRSAQERYLSAAARLEEQQEQSRAALDAADSLFVSLQSRAFRGDL